MKMNTEIIPTFEKQFEALKTKHNIPITLDQLDAYFQIRDMIAQQEFINTNIPRTIARRMVDLLMSWMHYLHSLLIPNPQSLVNMTESQMFTEEEKEQINSLIKKVMQWNSKNAHLAVQNDQAKDMAFIVELNTFWEKELIPQMHTLTQKINKSWEEKN